MDYFNLKFHNTTVRNEVFAGIALFMAMSYILIVNPAVLADAGMDPSGVFFSTVLVSGFATIVSAFYTKLPIALAPGLGLTGIFASMTAGENGIHWSVLLLATYVAGILICAFVKFGVYDKIMEIMDHDFRKMLMSGIGCALLLYGVSTTGIIKSTGAYYLPGTIEWIPLAITVLSLLIIYVMKHFRIKAHVLIGLLTAYVLSIGASYFEAYNATGIAFDTYIAGIFSVSYHFSDISKVMFKFPSLEEVFGQFRTFIPFVNAVFAITMGHFFDAIGTNTAAFDAINNDVDSRIKGTLSLKRAITVDGIGNVVSGVMGTSTVTSYAESMVGIVSGGKTGITALTTGCLFLLCFFFAPLFTSMATYVAAPALIYVGITLTMRFKEFAFKDKKILGIFGIALIAYVGVTFHIGNAVLYGLVIYTVLKMITRKEKAPPYWWVALIFAAFHILLNLMA